ncbi:MAG: L-lactate dehydrogenase [Deltaproteobacteria bacterium]|nr:L-lactate dehydrogenase [Deltaproteobacteria bacterium]
MKYRVLIVGAGAVGVACAMSMMYSQIASHLILTDIKMDKAQGEALDLAHAAPLMGAPQVEALPMDALVPVDLCVITAGAKQHPGETRLELLARNAHAMREIAEAIERGGLPRVVVVVSNPVDVMTELLRARWEPLGVAVLGTGTVLDTTRLRSFISEKFAIHPSSVHAWVLGEHGDSSVSMLDSARVAGVPLREFCARNGVPFDDAWRDALTREVRGAAQEIIARKGATSHAIGAVTARIARAIARDERTVLTVSTYSKELSCTLGLPAIVGSHGATSLGLPECSARERSELAHSAEVVREAIAQARAHLDQRNS